MRVLDRYPWLAERFEAVREESRGMYCTAECPLKCHSVARLRFWLGMDGRLMFGCYGCGKAAKLEILRAAGLSWKDTFPQGLAVQRHHQEIVERYPYRDENGVTLYESVRLEPGLKGRDKTFRQRRPARAGSPCRGGWVWSLDDVRRVLFDLPDLLAADPERPVFVVAGEKDVRSLQRLGLVATTNVCGESAEWLDGYSRALAGRHAVVIEDGDAAGRRHAHEVCGSLLEHAGSVRRTRLPAKDATAYLNGLRMEGVTDPDELRDDLLSVLGETRCWVGV